MMAAPFRRFTPPAVPWHILRSGREAVRLAGAFVAAAADLRLWPTSVRLVGLSVALCLGLSPAFVQTMSAAHADDEPRIALECREAPQYMVAAADPHAVEAGMQILRREIAGDFRKMAKVELRARFERRLWLV